MIDAIHDDVNAVRGYICMSVGIDNRKYGRRLLVKSLFIKLRPTYPLG